MSLCPWSNGQRPSQKLRRTPTYWMEDVDRGVAVRANERLGSLKLHHCCSRHLPYSKCCLNEYYVPTLRYLARVTSAHDLHFGSLVCGNCSPTETGSEKRQGIQYGMRLFWWLEPFKLQYLGTPTMFKIYVGIFSTRKKQATRQHVVPQLSLQIQNKTFIPFLKNKIK